MLFARRISPTMMGWRVFVLACAGCGGVTLGSTGLAAPARVATVAFVCTDIQLGEVAQIPANSPAYRVGVRKGDLIAAVDGRRVWYLDVSEFDGAEGAGPVRLTLLREGSGPLVVAVPRPARITRIEERYACVVEQDIEPGSVEHRAGLRRGDTVIAIDGKRPADGANQALVGAPRSEVRLTLLRDGGHRIEVTVPRRLGKSGDEVTFSSPPQPFLEATGDGTAPSVTLATKCTGVPDLGWSPVCKSVYEATRSSGTRIAPTAEAVRAITSPGRYFQPHNESGFYDATISLEEPWLLQFPVLAFELDRPKGAASTPTSIEVAVKESVRDRTPYLQVVNEESRQPGITLVNQGAGATRGGVLEYDLEPYHDASRALPPRCAGTPYPRRSAEELDAYLAEANVPAGSDTRPYRFSLDVPGFKDILNIFLFDGMVQAIPELEPVERSLARLLERHVGRAEEAGSVRWRALAGTQAIRRASGGVALVGAEAGKFWDRLRREVCIPKCALMEGRLRVRGADTTAPAHIEHFRSRVCIRDWEGGAAGPALEFPDAVALRPDGRDYMVRQALRRRQEGDKVRFDLLLFVRESSTHTLSIRLLASDGRPLWQSPTMTVHVVVPGHAIRIYSADERSARLIPRTPR